MLQLSTLSASTAYLPCTRAPARSAYTHSQTGPHLPVLRVHVSLRFLAMTLILVRIIEKWFESGVMFAPFVGAEIQVRRKKLVSTLFQNAGE